MRDDPMSDETTPAPSLLEFGGPVGNLILTFVLPLIVVGLYFSIGFNDGGLWPNETVDYDAFWRSLIPDPTVGAVYLAWFALQVVLQVFMPGRVVEGTVLPGGGRLRYKINGLSSLVVTLVVVTGLHLSGVLRLSYLHDHFGAIFSTSTIFVYGFSVFLFFYGKMHGQYRGTDNVVHDFFMGSGHNPRIPANGLFDLKFFCEARPGLILWILVDASFAFVQYERHGFVSLSMILVCAFQWAYVIDYYLNESSILTTMDIKHENFGFMLAFGDLVWVPMTYGLQAYYLIDHMLALPWWAGVLIVGMNLAGLWVFRAVNNQKNHFRSSPDAAMIWGKPAEYIQTKRGTKLLLSGFWGLSRHFNYVGDLLMALAWSLPCGFAAPVPFFYPIYFAILLIHRERRDHHFCRNKYGEDWDRYCERVRWRIVPFVY